MISAKFLDALWQTARASGRPLPAAPCLRAVFTAGLSLTDAAWLDEAAVTELFNATAAALAAAPWRDELTDADIWHYILQPRVNEEALLPHRSELQRQLQPLLTSSATRTEAALAINRWCAERVHYEASDSRCLDPLSVLRRGRGRCGEESTLLVACLRAAGIPARQVYAPRWLHVNDNHAWVEVRTDEFWHYLGACEPEPWLDHAWFDQAARLAPLVVARRFGFAAAPDPEAELRLPVRGLAADLLGVTERYAETRPVSLRLTLPPDTLHVAVEPLLPNWGQLAPLAQFDVDPAAARLDLRLGGCGLLLRVVCTRASGREVRELSLAAGLEPVELAVDFTQAVSAPEGWRRWDFELPLLAPATPWPPVVPDAQPDSSQNAEQPPTANDACDYPLAQEGEEALVTLIRREAGDRTPDWLALLEQDESGLYARMLRQLRAKDLVDTDPLCLVERAALWREDSRLVGLEPREVDAYALGLRVADEMLLPFGALLPIPLESYVDAEREWAEGREAAARWLPPALLLAAGRGNRRSVDLLAVALARRSGWAARLGPSDGRPEFWVDGAWCRLDALPVGAPGELTIGFRSADPGLRELVADFACHLVQHENFGIARLGADGFYEAVDLEFRHLDGRLVAAFAAGSYRLTLVQRTVAVVTGVWLDFAIKNGERKEIAIEVDDDLLRLFAG
ncbi:MAG: transglutaminase-like domain-containing protein [Bacillota bacterium]|nr:transglutaminase-like domain-containing protein [Bacillota bacterium]